MITYTERLGKSIQLFALSKGMMIVAVAISLAGSGFSFSKLAFDSFAWAPIHDDSAWYAAISTEGYWAQNTVFYPLYPVLITVAHVLTGASVQLLGLAIAAIFATLDIWLLNILTARVLGSKSAWYTAVIWAIFPTSLFLSDMYTESLFIFGILACFLALHHKRFGLAALAGASATLTRNEGILLLIPYMAAVYDIYKETGTWRQAATWAAAMPAAIGAYMVYVWVRFGSPLLPVVQEKIWGRHFLFPVLTLIKGFSSVHKDWLSNGYYGHSYYLLEWGAVALALVCLPTIWARLPRAWFWWTICMIAVPLADPGLGNQYLEPGHITKIADYFFSFDRFILPIVPVFMALGILAGESSARRRIIFGLSTAGLMTCTIFTNAHYFVG